MGGDRKPEENNEISDQNLAAILEANPSFDASLMNIFVIDVA
jgi:hypothetical protein